MDSTAPVKVFIIYARENAPFKDRLVTVLSQSVRRGEMTVFHDRLIIPGENWNDRISAELKTARIAVLLLSFDYYASQFIHDKEAKAARQRYENGELHILPVFVEACKSSWEDDDFLTTIQFLPSNGPIARLDNADAFDEVAGAVIQKAKEIRRLLKEEIDQKERAEKMAVEGLLLAEKQEKEAKIARLAAVAEQKRIDGLAKNQKENERIAALAEKEKQAAEKADIEQNARFEEPAKRLSFADIETKADIEQNARLKDEQNRLREAARLKMEAAEKAAEKAKLEPEQKRFYKEAAEKAKREAIESMRGYIAARYEASMAAARKYFDLADQKNARSSIADVLQILPRDAEARRLSAKIEALNVEPSIFEKNWKWFLVAADLLAGYVVFNQLSPSERIIVIIEFSALGAFVGWLVGLIFKGGGIGIVGNILTGILGSFVTFGLMEGFGLALSGNVWLKFSALLTIVAFIIQFIVWKIRRN